MNIKFYTLLVLLIISFSVQSKKDLPNSGDVAPDFEITQLNGTKFKLSDYKDKQSVYLVFWNTWCPLCMKKIPKLKSTQLNLAHDIKVIAVNTTNKDSLEESLEFQKRFDINYPLAFDFGKNVTDLYNVWGTPTEFIIDINGIIRHRDGVPEKLENHLTQWNTKTIAITQAITNYYNLVITFFNNIKNTS